MKYLLTLLVFCSIFTAHAQHPLDEGNRIFGGGISIRKSDYEEPHLYNSLSSFNQGESSSFAFSPYYGRLYTDDKMIGVRFNVSSSNRNDFYESEWSITDSEYSVSSYSVGGFIRKYFRVEESFGVYLQSGADIATFSRDRRESRVYLENSSSDYNRSSEGRGYSVSVGSNLGLYYFIFSRLSMEINLLDLTIHHNIEDVELRDISEEETRNEDATSTSLNLRFANSFTLDRLFTLNYYF